MAEKHILAEQDYMQGLKYKEIAEKYSVTLNTVKSWKKRYGWQRKKGAYPLKSMHTKKEDARQGNQNVPNTVKVERFKPLPETERDVLTDKQRLFVMEYLRDFNATRAAMTVGYSKKTAHTSGWKMLRNEEIRAEIERQKGLTTSELGLSIQRVIAELMKIAFADISDVMEYGVHHVPLRDKEGNIVLNQEGNPVTEKHNFVTLKNADEMDSTVISEVKKTREGVSVKLHDKLKAIEKLERYLPYRTEEEKLKMDKTRAEIKAIETKAF